MDNFVYFVSIVILFLIYSSIRILKMLDNSYSCQKSVRINVQILFLTYMWHKTFTSYNSNRIELETNNLPRGYNDSFLLNGGYVCIPMNIGVSLKYAQCKPMSIAINIVHRISNSFQDTFIRYCKYQYTYANKR